MSTVAFSSDEKSVAHLPKKIVLIGFMGSGKSSVASLLAEKMRYHHVDTDTLIISQSSYDSIPQIFDSEGETAFRQLELDVTHSLYNAENTVIATGGGVVMNQLTMNALCHNAYVIYLKTALATVIERVGEDTNRPLLRDKETLRRLYTMRCALYEYYADWTIETDASSPEDIVEHIQSFLLNQNVLVSC